MSQEVQSYGGPCNFPVIPKYDFPNRLVPKYGRAPPYMWGNPFCQMETFVQKKNQTKNAGSDMKIKRTSTPKISNESKTSPVLSGKGRSGSLVLHTALKDTEILQREMNEKNKPYLMFAKIQDARSGEERLDFVNRYQAANLESLENCLLQKTPSEVYSLTQALFQTDETIMTHSLHNTVEIGTGGIDLSLIEILFLSSFEQKQRYAKLYSQLYPGTNLQRDIMDNADSNVQKLCLALLQNKQKEMGIDSLAQAQKDAKDLMDASKSERVDKIIEILTTNGRGQLSLFIQEFYEINAEKLSKFISNGIPRKHRFGDLFQSALKLIIYLVEDPIRYKAEKLGQMLKYLGTMLNPNATQSLDVCRRKQVIHRMFIVDKQEMVEIGKKIKDLEGITLETLIQNIQEVKYRSMLLTFVRDNGW